MVCLSRLLHFKGEMDDELEKRNWLVKDLGTVHKDDECKDPRFTFNLSLSLPLHPLLLLFGVLHCTLSVFISFASHVPQVPSRMDLEAFKRKTKLYPSKSKSFTNALMEQKFCVSQPHKLNSPQTAKKPRNTRTQRSSQLMLHRELQRKLKLEIFVPRNLKCALHKDS